MNTDLLTILDIIGAVSFTISGSLLATRKKMDYLGVCILGIVTAVGGGATRDLIIGNTPPVMFTNPIYVAISFVVANLVFLYLYFHINVKAKPKMSHFFENALFWFDTIGLASFTVNGVMVGVSVDESNIFLCTFLGVITGVGGGVLRDLLATEVPAIFRKHVYAMASIAGALATSLLWPVAGNIVAVAVGMVIIILIRYLAKRFEWNLPHIH
ncbi:MAG: trimeric intracellular cation channel family protein [Spirochaetales bacterium]|nr:trimeric intracellular cation channel family protein [Spirochaetales bacterium]